MNLVDKHRMNEEEAQGRNPLARLRPLSASTQRKLAKIIAPIQVRNGGVQNSSRRRALKDSRNAISCAATWPAVAEGTTMTQQPNDAGHMHKTLKKCFKGKKYRGREVVVPPYLVGFDETLAERGVEPGSLSSYWKALCYFETALSRACTMPMVSKGFEIAGIYPLDQVRMLSKWSGWRMCSKQTGLDVLGKLPMLTNIAKQRGRVLDGEIEASLEGILTFDAATRKSDDYALNHSRCLWTNNSAVVEKFAAKR
jgi:hypothetical protein